MAVEQSILKSVKKNLGLDANYDAFDNDVITHTNSAFFTLYQLGVGPVDGFAIEGDEEEWAGFTGPGVSKPVVNAVKTYIHLYVRLIFDPPEAAHHIAAAKEQKDELVHRLLVEREIYRFDPTNTLAP